MTTAQQTKTDLLVSENEIYGFMKIAIADQKLSLDYGFEIEPEHYCNLGKEDKDFLKELLIDTIKKEIKQDTTPVDVNHITFTATAIGGQLRKCLTQQDIDYMLKQKDKFKNFKWDNSRLGFNLNNDKNWYVFSIPLFSADRTKAIMMIRNLCPGLCGTGWTVLFTKDNGKWSSRTGGQWIH